MLFTKLDFDFFYALTCSKQIGGQLSKFTGKEEDVMML